ncbi:hypothetical protein [Plantibacter sp. M259]|uniref:hypothetical protein n=1 Tax=Plantibacter sp. M259 TaxID=2583822 RepID=UPI00143D33FB|nr:hypothetical protein [Plantibacter sp. M259]
MTWWVVPLVLSPSILTFTAILTITWLKERRVQREDKWYWSGFLDGVESVKAREKRADNATAWLTKTEAPNADVG